jgi:hypothetical protein
MRTVSLDGSELFCVANQKATSSKKVLNQPPQPADELRSRPPFGPLSGVNKKAGKSIKIFPLYKSDLLLSAV